MPKNLTMLRNSVQLTEMKLNEIQNQAYALHKLKLNLIKEIEEEESRLESYKS